MQKSARNVSNLARKLLKRDPAVIFEMGANDAEDTIGFAKEFPRSTIYSFECNPESLPVCRNKVKEFPNIVFTEKAVSDHRGTIKFFPTTNGNPGASSIFKETGKYPVEKYSQTETEVDTVTISDFCKERNLKEIDLLWMDMQGSELAALKGVADVKINIIHTEAEFLEVYEGQPLFKDVRSYLEKNGFSLYSFTHFGRYSCDAIFISSDIPISFMRRKMVFPFYNLFWKYVQFIGRKI